MVGSKVNKSKITTIIKVIKKIIRKTTIKTTTDIKNERNNNIEII